MRQTCQQERRSGPPRSERPHLPRLPPHACPTQTRWLKTPGRRDIEVPGRHLLVLQAPPWNLLPQRRRRRVAPISSALERVRLVDRGSLGYLAGDPFLVPIERLVVGHGEAVEPIAAEEVPHRSPRRLVMRMDPAQTVRIPRVLQAERHHSGVSFAKSWRGQGAQRFVLDAPIPLPSALTGVKS